jgi:CheY-like chemotaxis protein
MARVLVIDDDPTVRSLISGLLEAQSHTVSLAADGHAGVALFDQGGIDLVITDLVMPVQEGIATIGAIRRLNSTVPVLAISGSTTRGRYGDYLNAAELLGATATLTKPLDPESLMETVERLLRPA